ncbi:hypothetical protein BOTBODRAFT_500296 [Botryobasidium botryosum FD-172 SS1]|uniref:Uncharacterized protein n=1 Tax=Botryobasidium botryosum (strain FD-172 SS1) TaxID=930990 RepID=A0A067MEN2_BOTB1|nr:hypothetical protein BOTBODRAFT_500296 [Botryobasidium botryosum FD-172 SS1]
MHSLCSCSSASSADHVVTNSCRASVQTDLRPSTPGRARNKTRNPSIRPQPVHRTPVPDLINH